MGKSSRVAAAAAKITAAPRSMLPPLPSEVVAQQEAEQGPMTDEERLAALQAAAEAPPTIPVIEAPKPAEVPAEVRGRRVRYSTDDYIVVRKNNPKRPGTAGHDRYAIYQTGMQVKTYMADRRIGKFARADLAWDLDRRFISIVPRGELAAAVAEGEVVGREGAVALIESWSAGAEIEATKEIAEAQQQPDEVTAES